MINEYAIFTNGKKEVTKNITTKDAKICQLKRKTATRLCERKAERRISKMGASNVTHTDFVPKKMRIGGVVLSLLWVLERGRRSPFLRASRKDT